MSQILVDGGDLGGDLLSKLSDFLNNIATLKIQAKLDGKQIVVTDKTPATRQAIGKTTTKKPKKVTEKRKKKKTMRKETHVSKTKLKVYLKRFINKQGLSDDVRVISGGKDSFTFHAKPIYEVEPEAEEGA
jgi:hypothetical protein